MLTEDATTVWKYLNGIICIYKPAMVSMSSVRKLLCSKLALDLNELKCRKPRNYVSIDGDTRHPLNVNIRSSYADHPLVIGPRYIPEEIKVRPAKFFEKRTSGVCIMGINYGIRRAFYLNTCNPLCTYHITGQFGLATDNLFSDGKIIYKSNFEYIRKPFVDEAVASIQANHQKNLFSSTGFHPQSQTAYELAVSGMVRPVDKNVPVIYSIKCIQLNLPYFILEVVSVNENEDYLLNLVHEVGYRIKNLAITTAVHCIRHSYFSLENAILKKHWSLQNILDNLNHCNDILKLNKEFSIYLQQKQEEEKKFFSNCNEDLDAELENEMDIIQSEKIH